MADEQLIPLEDGDGEAVAPPPESPPATPETPPAVTPETPEPPPQAAAPPSVPEPAQTVPLSVLLAERAETKSWRDRATAGLTLAQRIADRPDIQALLERAPAPTAPAPPPERDMYELAQSLALYNGQGQPDIEAAGRVHAVMLRVANATAQTHATREVERAVAPLRQESQQSRASLLRNEAVTILNDFAVDEETRGYVLNALPPEMQANDASMSSAVLLALGAQAFQKRYGKAQALPAAAVVPANGNSQPAANPHAPVFVEGATHRPAVTPTISDFEKRIARDNGIKEADWLKARAPLDKAQPGERILLEGDGDD